MLKRIAILAVAVLWVSAGDSLFSGALPSTIGSKSSSYSSAHLRPNTRTRRLHHTRRRRRARRWTPWHTSSFGEPAAQDDPVGEDPAIRAAAIEAIGNWNGSIVVVDPNTGRILSIVNQKLALSGAFTPCSTFKPVVGLAALKEGIITPETQLRVFGRARMNLTEALAHSNNHFFAELGEMLGFRRVAQYANEFGLGQRAGWNIFGESPGRFPLAPPREGGVGSLTSFGQNIEVTPLQLAAIISAIANGGTLYYLQYPRTPEEIAQFEPKVRRYLDGFGEYFPQLKEGLAAAVLYGTAKQAYNAEEQIYGKTGTCSEDGVRLGWFASYADERQPKYVVVVLLRGGRPMFGPHAAEIAGRLYRDLHQREKTGTQANRSALPANQPQR